MEDCIGKNKGDEAGPGRGLGVKGSPLPAGSPETARFSGRRTSHPKDIFTQRPERREMNMPLDRLSGEIARRVIEAFREQVIREIKVYED